MNWLVDWLNSQSSPSLQGGGDCYFVTWIGQIWKRQLSRRIALQVVLEPVTRIQVPGAVVYWPRAWVKHVHLCDIPVVTNLWWCLLWKTKLNLTSPPKIILLTSQKVYESLISRMYEANLAQKNFKIVCLSCAANVLRNQTRSNSWRWWSALKLLCLLDMSDELPAKGMLPVMFKLTDTLI